jgi:shikimate dehydrogenase
MILTGHNTDSPAFAESLRHFKFDRRSALVLGNGGAAAAICNALQQMKFKIRSVSRNPKQTGVLSYDNLDEEIINSVDLIVNTTPLGMSPNTEHAPPLPYLALKEQHLVYDLIYNPEKTLFLKKAEAQGARIKNGMEMLEQQAEISYKIIINTIKNF